MVPVFRGLRGPGDRDRHCRHRRHRRLAAGHGRRSAECAVARDDAAPMGTACARLLDLNHAGSATRRHEPDLVDVSRHGGAPRRVRPGSLLSIRQRLAASAGAAGTLPARADRLRAALLRHPELRGALARWAGRRGGRGDRDRNPQDRLCDLYRLDVVLPDGLRRAGGNPDLSVVDVRVLDGGAAGRRGRGQSADLAGR